MNKAALLTMAKRLGSDEGLFIMSVFDLEPRGIIVQAYNQSNSKEYCIPITENELSESGISRHVTSLRTLVDTLSLVPQGTEDFVLESSIETISKIKKRPVGDALEIMMKTPMAEGSDSLQELLVTGLMELCKAKPTGLDAVQWLGEWLIANNPNKPNVEIPS